MSTYSIQQGDYSQINKDIRISIITAEFNQIFTKQLEEINIKFLESEGFTNINTYQVPGAFEIPGLANKILSEKKADLILCFGVVVQGETPHFDYICAESARGLMTLTTQYTTPIINGILTCYKEEQVVERIKPVYAISGLNTLIAYQK